MKHKKKSKVHRVKARIVVMIKNIRAHIFRGYEKEVRHGFI